VLRQRVSAYSWNCRTQCHIVSLYWICTMASLDCSYYVSNYFRCLSHYPLPSYRPFHLILLLPFGPDGRNLVWFCTSDCRWLVSVLDFACRVGGGGSISRKPIKIPSFKLGVCGAIFRFLPEFNFISHSSCLYRASMTIKTLYYPTDAQIYRVFHDFRA